MFSIFLLSLAINPFIQSKPSIKRRIAYMINWPVREFNLWGFWHKIVFLWWKMYKRSINIQTQVFWWHKGNGKRGFFMYGCLISCCNRRDITITFKILVLKKRVCDKKFYEWKIHLVCNENFFYLWCLLFHQNGDKR